METRPSSKTSLNVIRVRRGEKPAPARRDDVATEEPLEIRLVTGNTTQQVAITMRTPGADFELSAGFLFAEGIIHSKDDIQAITYCVDRELSEEQRYNVVNVNLRHDAAKDLRKLERHFVVSSACGVCGKASLDALETDGLRPLVNDARVSSEQILALPDELRQAQRLFDSTGGLHAAALFDLDGTLLAVREDVGRHNAMDKLIGWALLNGHIPLERYIVLVSGRASFELAQKALAASIPILCAISAPSSLAVDVARRFGMTLVAFLRDDRFNLYCGSERIVDPTF
ncbi:MAG: formate dehydrogenase accessory sulfurtransferase FdhD [Burkholderiales bacterium]|nr:formate dehydrogenase accessory sulfurtransferase FdhD [Anaerolineae bacterium]